MLHSAGKALQRPRRFPAKAACSTVHKVSHNYNVEQCNCGRHNMNLSSEANFCNVK